LAEIIHLSFSNTREDELPSAFNIADPFQIYSPFDGRQSVSDLALQYCNLFLLFWVVCRQLTEPADMAMNLIKGCAIRLEVRFFSCDNVAAFSRFGVFHRGKSGFKLCQDLVCVRDPAFVVNQAACGTVGDQLVNEQKYESDTGTGHNLSFDRPFHLRDLSA